MNVAKMSPREVEKASMEAIVRALGPAGLARFLQQVDPGSGDYSKDRHQQLPEEEVAVIAAAIRAKRRD
jgi:hypothetical protein